MLGFWLKRDRPGFLVGVERPRLGPVPTAVVLAMVVCVLTAGALAACGVRSEPGSADGQAMSRPSDADDVTAGRTDTEWTDTGRPEGDGQPGPFGVGDDLAAPQPTDPASPVDQAVPDTGGVVVGHAQVATVVARSKPDLDADVVAELTNPTPVGGPLAFQLVDIDPPDDGAQWVEVHLPVRPNGTTGWVPVGDLALSLNPFRIEISTGRHRLQVFHGDELWLDTEVAIGTGRTPTPLGRFYIIELLQPPDPTGPYGPYAFGLSGFSETLTSFAGGDGVIGIHGTNDPAALGSDVSHGCIRMANDVIETLAGVVPLGTPVHISS